MIATIEPSFIAPHQESTTIDAEPPRPPLITAPANHAASEFIPTPATREAWRTKARVQVFASTLLSVITAQALAVTVLLLWIFLPRDGLHLNPSWFGAAACIWLLLAYVSLPGRLSAMGDGVRPAVICALGAGLGALWGASLVAAHDGLGASEAVLAPFDPGGYALAAMSVSAIGVLATRGAVLSFTYTFCASLALSNLATLSIMKVWDAQPTGSIAFALSTLTIAMLTAWVGRALGLSANREVHLTLECDEYATVVTQLAQNGVQIRRFGVQANSAAGQSEPRLLDSTSAVAGIASNPIDSLGTAVVAASPEGHFLFANKAAQTLCGIGNDATGQLVDELLSIAAPDGPIKLVHLIQTAANGNQAILADQEMELHHPDGSAVFAITLRLSCQTTELGSPVLIEIEDVTELRSLIRLAHYHESHDALTGLPNRREFMRRVQDALRGDSHPAGAAICFIDLNHLDNINDTCGHLAGDTLLRRMADGLAATVRGTDTLARVGGDQFALLLEDCPRERAIEISQGLLDYVHSLRFPWDEQVLEVSASVGVATSDSVGEQYSDCYGAAHAACLEARRRGGRQIYIHDPATRLSSPASELVRWMQRVRSAIEHGQFQLQVQPIVPLDPNSGLSPRGELLIRILGENGELIAPEAFIAAAEHYDLMTRVDRWVIENAIKAVARKAPSLAGLRPCAINLSGQSLGDPTLLEFTLDALDSAGVDPSDLCFEITETALVENLDVAQRFIEALNARGCQFSLDDFGTGSSSYAYLKNLPVSCIKIDGTFIRDLAEDRIDQALVESINQMGHRLGMSTVAEHVEDEAVLEWLRNQGVDYGQGSLLGAPRPVI